jgi:hypothetical protein
MNRDNVSLFRWDGCSPFRDTAPCDQPGNRQLWPDDRNHGIEGNMRRLVHGEILRHLRAVGACLSFVRMSGIIAGVSFIQGNLQQKTNGHLIEGRRVPPASTHFRKEAETFGRNRQFQSFSTSRGRVIVRQFLEMSPVQGSHIDSTIPVKCFRSSLATHFRASAMRNRAPIPKGLGRILRFDHFSRDIAAPLSRAVSRHLAEGSREGSLIAKARLNCYFRNRLGRLPK